MFIFFLIYFSILLFGILEIINNPSDNPDGVDYNEYYDWVDRKGRWPNMNKEISEKKKVNPLVYILGIPVGIYILVLSYNAWEKDRLFRECSQNINYLGGIYKKPPLSGYTPHCLTVLGR